MNRVTEIWLPSENTSASEYMNPAINKSKYEPEVWMPSDKPNYIQLRMAYVRVREPLPKP